MKFEYRYEEQGNEWEECGGDRFWDSSDVAEFVAEQYWDNGDGGDGGDANKFEFEIEVRELEKPETLQKFVVTADYSVNFYAREAE